MDAAAFGANFERVEGEREGVGREPLIATLLVARFPKESAGPRGIARERSGTWFGMLWKPPARARERWRAFRRRLGTNRSGMERAQTPGSA